MNKKTLSLMLAGVLTAGLLSACGNQNGGASGGSASSTGSAGSAGASGKQTTFTVGFDAEFPPYGYQDENGQFIGFDLDLAQEVAKRNGWEYVAKPIDWDSKDFELESGSIDCIWNGFTMNGREDDYTWSDPYIDNSQIIVTTAESGITELAGLAGKNVAVQADSSALAALNDEEMPENIALRDSFEQMLEVPDYNTAFMNLESGAVDAVAMDIGVANYQISQRGTDKFVILKDKLAAEQYAVGFKKGNTELRDSVQKTLNEMVEDGTFQSIVDKWSENGLSADSIILGK